MKTPEQLKRYAATRRAKAAAKAKAEGRAPGRVGAPPRLSAQEKEASRKAQNRKRCLRSAAKRKAARAAKALSKGLKPGVVGLQSRLTPKERKAASVAKTIRCREKNREKYLKLSAAAAAEKRRLKKLGLWVPKKKVLTAEQRKLQAVAHSQNRRARKRNNGGKHTRRDIENLIVSQNGCCAMCLIPFGEDGFHVDHVIPLSAGGSNDRENIQLLHPTCNLKKGAMIAPDATTLASC